MLDFINLLSNFHLTHPLVATVMFLVINLFTMGNLTAATIGPLLFYYSRELRDTEERFHTWIENDLSLLNPFKWNKDEQWGFWPVVAVLS